MGLDFTAPPLDEVHSQVDHVCDACGFRRLGAAVRVAGGTLNWNYRVPTTAGPVFARRWRAELPVEEIRREHALLEWVSERGIPVARPLKSADGGTAVSLAGANWSLFPWVRGRTLVRGKIKPTDANSLGEMHGRIHAVLSRHPASGDPPVLVPWDTGSSLADLALVRAAAEDAGALGEVVDAIDFQMMLLRESAVVPRSVLAGLPAQLTHGDFHDDQVLVNRRGDVRAVVDWGLLRVMPRIWEVIRSLSYSRLLEGECLDSYLAGYRQHVRLSEAECRLGVEAWWYGRLHARWVYWTYFFEKNVRVAEFFAETARHLRQLSDQRWRDDLANRLVRAASAQ